MTKAAKSQLSGPFDIMKRRVRAVQRRHYARWRKKLLVALANLRDDGCAHFRRAGLQRGGPLFHDDPLLKDDHAILQFRDQLRNLWCHGPNWEIVLGSWVNLCCTKQLWTWTVPGWSDGTYSVEPNYTLFPLALGIAAGEWMSKMAFCGNPECPAPHFLKGRKTQRFCERGSCAAYGQRQHALNWWRRVGVKRRALGAQTRLGTNRKERKWQ
jgi:hypothetical protein